MLSILLFFEGVGTSELLFILFIVLVFFGPKKIPDLARGLGKGIREFKDASNEIRNEFERSSDPHNGQSNPNFSLHNQPASQPYQPQSAPYTPALEIYPPAPGAYGSPADAGYSAPGSVILPPAAPVAHAHDTPLPPGSAPFGSARPTLDQPTSDASS